VTVVGVSTGVIVAVGVAVVALVALVLVLAPWKSVRDERPLDPAIETRLLLGEDPQTVAADADAAEAQHTPVVDFNAHRTDDD